MVRSHLAVAEREECASSLSRGHYEVKGANPGSGLIGDAPGHLRTARLSTAEKEIDDWLARLPWRVESAGG